MAIVESLKSPFHSKSTPANPNTLKSFEEIYKTSYSHGLEAIYAIERIDLKSIRRLSDKPEVHEAASKNPKKNSPNKPEQLSFNFGVSYRNWMESFILREPIQVLALSKPAEKCLLANGKNTINDLVESDIRSFIFFKGMGQGHIDEIQQKMAHYINGRPLHQSDTINMAAWIRSLLGSAEKKKSFAALQPFGLEFLISLSMSENIETNRLEDNQRRQWQDEIYRDLRKVNKQQVISQDLHTIVEVFLKPWVRKRHGLATQQEIWERLQRISDDAILTKHVFDLISAIYFNGQFPLKNDLLEINEGLFCSDPHIAEYYLLAVKTAQSYFYNSQICYNFSHLLMLIARELAKTWQGFADGFLEKALRLSPCFQIQKESGGNLMISLSV